MFESPHARESMIVSDSGFHPVDSGFRVLDSGFQLSGFQIPKRAGFQILSVLMLFFAFRNEGDIGGLSTPNTAEKNNKQRITAKKRGETSTSQF